MNKFLKKGRKGIDTKVLVIVIALVISFMIGMLLMHYIDTHTFELRNPVVIKLKTSKETLVSPRFTRVKKEKVYVVKKVEASAKIAEFPKLLTEQGVSTRKRVLAMLSKHYNGNQLIAFDNLIKKESAYRYDAVNASSGACGIPQSLPCSKMGCTLDEAGEVCQIEWMINYIENRYGSPMEAYNFHLENNWY